MELEMFGIEIMIHVLLNIDIILEFRSLFKIY